MQRERVGSGCCVLAGLAFWALVWLLGGYSLGEVLLYSGVSLALIVAVGGVFWLLQRAFPSLPERVPGDVVLSVRGRRRCIPLGAIAVLVVVMAVLFWIYRAVFGG